VAKVKHFHCSFIFADQIIDENWAVYELSNARPFSDRVTHSRKAAQQVRVIEQSAAKAGRGFRVILGNVADNILEIVYCSLREEDAVIH
jgi:hypothetical protein